VGVDTTEPLRVLMVEDSSSDAKLLLRELKRLEREIEHERVETAEALAEQLARREWDVVLSDWNLPKFGGRAALAQLRATGADCPFIIVSATVEEAEAVEAIRAGAQDFVIKGNLARLLPLLERELREHASRKARRAAGMRDQAER
jgi:DNA-binding NtrC family response regulator